MTDTSIVYTTFKHAHVEGSDVVVSCEASGRATALPLPYERTFSRGEDKSIQMTAVPAGSPAPLPPLAGLDDWKIVGFSFAAAGAGACHSLTVSHTHRVFGFRQC